eukprot:5539667-Amphidinium_carterae.1
MHSSFLHEKRASDDATLDTSLVPITSACPYLCQIALRGRHYLCPLEAGHPEHAERINTANMDPSPCPTSLRKSTKNGLY